MNDRIRRCTPEDARAVAAIYDPIVADTAISFEELPPGPNELQRRIIAAQDHYPWLVLECDDTVSAYAYSSPHRSRAAYRWSVEVSVYVAPAARRAGIAGRLYAALFDILEAQGYCAAFAGVTLPNEPSLNLHRSVGFTLVGTYHKVGFKFGRWHDVMWFERRLRPDVAAPQEPLSLGVLAMQFDTYRHL